MKRRPNGAGSFQRVNSGKYKMRLQVGYQANGKPKILTVTGRTKSECIRLMETKQQQYLNVAVSYARAPYTLTELCIAHLNDHLSQRGRLKPNSADRRECTINNQIAKYPIGAMAAVQVTTRDIKDHIDMLIDDTHLSVSSIDKTYDVINSAYKWANSKGILSVNPCTPIMDEIKARLRQLIRRGLNDADVIILSAEEEDALIAECHKTYKNGNPKYAIGPAVDFLLASGLRVGELCALRASDWNKETHTLTIMRTRSVVRNRRVLDWRRRNEEV